MDRAHRIIQSTVLQYYCIEVDEPTKNEANPCKFDSAAVQ
jgi:hypothetical protein